MCSLLRVKFIKLRSREIKIKIKVSNKLWFNFNKIKINYLLLYFKFKKEELKEYMNYEQLRKIDFSGLQWSLITAAMKNKSVDDCKN